MTPTETRSRRLFQYVWSAAANDDPLNAVEATSDENLIKAIKNRADELGKALKAGSKAPLGQGFNPRDVVMLAGLIAGHAYALAHNANTLNALELPKIAERIDL